MLSNPCRSSPGERCPFGRGQGRAVPEEEVSCELSAPQHTQQLQKWVSQSWEAGFWLEPYGFHRSEAAVNSACPSPYDCIVVFSPAINAYYRFHFTAGDRVLEFKSLPQ